ncbi:SAM-dependent methyltransferase [Nocardioides gansuensis]|uniref:SAM-dependent methyltransferase n=2 Tax=Nocardioides gansuensis TaxID=2138300 RepID=A0A2T8F7Y4_9ACTN|nr:SAM-dependent methyltransferase [Nocardioides gansuensis]
MDDFDATQFQKDNVAADAARELANLVFVLDVQEANPGITRLRDWTMAALAPQPGEVCVDVGCGTGADVRRFAELVGPAGRAVGVEPHPGLRAVAAERAFGTSAEFVDGDALALPFEDGSVDVLRCERVFQHLHDPGAAVREFARVLAPGGRVAVVDSDWGSAIWLPMGDPDVRRRYDEAFFARTPNPFAGRYLRPQLRAAGLAVDPDIGSSALVFDEALVANPLMVRINASRAVEEGALTAEEAARLETDLVRAAELGEAFLAVTLFSVVGRKS